MNAHHDDLLALRNAVLRVLNRNPETSKDARRIKRHLDRAIEGDGPMEPIHRTLSALPQATRLTIEGTRKASLEEIRLYRARGLN